ncbi:hypothetical protein [Kurthia senegalensis]|uniref:hypothetical protein n=1 Tax=Kurthia senegalensis TaxID=1033740 RepID=UPI0002896CBC|nr:hypothetical protein [Kurthia senegalensis]
MSLIVHRLPPIHQKLTIISTIVFVIEVVCITAFELPLFVVFLLIVDAVPFVMTTLLYALKGSVAAIPLTTIFSIIYMLLDSFYQKFQSERTLIRLFVMQRQANETNEQIMPLQRNYPDIVYTYRLLQLIGKESLTKQKTVLHAFENQFENCHRQNLKVLNDFGTSAKMILSFLTNGQTSVFMYRSLYKKEIIHWYEALEETLEKSVNQIAS